MSTNAHLRFLFLQLVSCFLQPTVCKILLGSPRSISTASEAVKQQVATCAIGNLDSCVVQALALDGVVVVTGVPGLATARESTLRVLGECAQKPADASMQSTKLADGTMRWTLATRTVNGFPEPLETKCRGILAPSRALRSLIASVSESVLQSLQSLLRPGKEVLAKEGGGSYASLTNIALEGEQLEHFHAYQKPVAEFTMENASLASTVPSRRSQAALDLHMDAGMFLSMVPSMLMSPDGKRTLEDDDAGLFVQLASGALVRVEPSTSNAMVFIVGKGWEDWINPSLRTPLRAAPHTLIMPRQRALRCWYGRMYLPAADALVPPYHVAYAAVRAASQHLAMKAQVSPESIVQQGSYADDGRRFSIAGIGDQVPDGYNAPACKNQDNKTGLFCWTMVQGADHWCLVPPESCNADEEMVCTLDGEFVPFPSDPDCAEKPDCPKGARDCVECKASCWQKPVPPYHTPAPTPIPTPMPPTPVPTPAPTSCGTAGSTCGGTSENITTCCDDLVCRWYTPYYSGCALATTRQ